MRVCLYWCRPSLNAQGAGSFKKSIYPLVRSVNVEVERDLGAGTELTDRPCRVVGSGRGREPSGRRHHSCEETQVVWKEDIELLFTGYYRKDKRKSVVNTVASCFLQKV